jgi:Domain of unknown function (DUF3850)
MQTLGGTDLNSFPNLHKERRPRMEHKVKSWPEFFEAILSGHKTHEVRRMTDRDYQVGDTLRLLEFDPGKGQYTGRELAVGITFVTSANSPCALSDSCLHPDYCILSVHKY